VLVGPEGGFAPGERSTLGDAVLVAVGPHVLRAVTAPAAVAAAIASFR
jgi:16S rRNA U1498 N3-methylase RsmE